VCIELAGPLYLAEDADDDFSVVSYMMKIMFYIRCYPNETIVVIGPARRCHECGLFLRPTMPNTILYTNNCI